ncbi:CPBP family intramembrane glutamic endopeptidase [Natrialbaceae archaeon A-arb3/5]
MTETARTDVDSGASGAVPGIGTALSAVTMAATFVPISRGVDDPAIQAAAAFAFVTVLAFLGARHAALDRRPFAVAAVCSNLAIVVLAGYALNQGITASLALPVGSASLSLVAVAFCTAGLTIGIGAAHFFGLATAGIKRRSVQTAGLTALGITGLLGAQLATVFLAFGAVLALGSLSQPELVTVSQLGMAVGMGGVAVGYLVVRGHDRSFLDVRVPTRRDLAWIGAGLVVLFGALIAISAMFYTTGVETSDHGTAQQAQDNPEILLVLIPASILIIGPVEEFLYRNIVQKELYGTFSRPGAVIVSSVIFAAVHALAYGTADAGQVIASLATVFGLSLVLGTIYERTGNVVVPAAIHGLYNALLFANLYGTYG